MTQNIQHSCKYTVKREYGVSQIQEKILYVYIKCVYTYLVIYVYWAWLIHVVFILTSCIVKSPKDVGTDIGNIIVELNLGD